jgi:hypothetical protein
MSLTLSGTGALGVYASLIEQAIAAFTGGSLFAVDANSNLNTETFAGAGTLVVDVEQAPRFQRTYNDGTGTGTVGNAFYVSIPPINNVLIAILQVSVGNQIITAGAGWQLGDQLSDATQSGAWAWRIANGTENPTGNIGTSTSTIFSWQTSAAWHVSVSEWSGNDIIGPVGPNTTHNQFSGAPFSPVPLVVAGNLSRALALILTKGGTGILQVVNTDPTMWNNRHGQFTSLGMFADGHAVATGQSTPALIVAGYPDVTSVQDWLGLEFEIMRSNPNASLGVRIAGTSSLNVSTTVIVRTSKARFAGVSSLVVDTSTTRNTAIFAGKGQFTARAIGVTVAGSAVANNGSAITPIVDFNSLVVTTPDFVNIDGLFLAVETGGAQPILDSQGNVVSSSPFSTVFAISPGGGLSWTRRAIFELTISGYPFVLELWYAPVGPGDGSGALASTTITANFDSPYNSATAICFGLGHLAGNSPMPFDVSAPSMAGVSGNSAIAASISTLNPQDIIICVNGVANLTPNVAPSGFILVNSTGTLWPPNGLTVSYKTVGQALNNFTVSSTGYMILDALRVT